MKGKWVTSNPSLSFLKNKKMTIEKYTKQQQEWFTLKGLCNMIKNSENPVRKKYVRLLYDGLKEYKEKYKEKFDYNEFPG